MPKNDIEKQLHDCVDGFVAEITTLVRQSAVQAVEEALLAGSLAKRAKSAPKKKSQRKAKAAPKGTRIRRSADDIEKLAGSFLSYVQKNPGQRLEQIAVALGEASKDLKRPVQMLLADRELRTKGQKRGTTYLAGAAKAGRKKATKKGGPKQAKKKTGSPKKAAKGPKKIKSKTAARSTYKVPSPKKPVEVA